MVADLVRRRLTHVNVGSSLEMVCFNLLRSFCLPSPALRTLASTWRHSVRHCSRTDWGSSFQISSSSKSSRLCHPVGFSLLCILTSCWRFCTTTISGSVLERLRIDQSAQVDESTDTNSGFVFALQL